MPDKILEIIPRERILFNEPLANRTTFRVGGPARYFALPANENEIISLTRFAKAESLPFCILGNGSNVVASDEGFDGVIICLGENMTDISAEEDVLTVLAGVRLSKIASFALNGSLTGFEHLGGIPGTLGGGIYMNAGAYGSEIADVCESVRFIDGGDVKEIPASEADFGYRKSIFVNSDKIIISAKLKLCRGDCRAIKEEMDLTAAKRREKQPLEYPSAGSTFKRPEGYFAAKLIEDCGLKGASVGGAQVSEKHSGFIINKGGATSSDIKELIKIVSDTVFDKTGVLLEPEVKFIG